jgi:hypothetical protein
LASSLESIEILEGSTIDYLPTPYRNSYRFLGWYLQGDQVKKGDTFDFNENIQLIAVWEKVTLNMTLIYIEASVLLVILTITTIIIIRKVLYRRKIAIGRNPYNDSEN